MKQLTVKQLMALAKERIVPMRFIGRKTGKRYVADELGPKGLIVKINM